MEGHKVQIGGPGAERGGPGAGRGGPEAGIGGPGAGIGGPGAGRGGPGAGRGGPGAGIGPGTKYHAIEIRSYVVMESLLWIGGQGQVVKRRMGLRMQIE